MEKCFRHITGVCMCLVTQLSLILTKKKKVLIRESNFLQWDFPGKNANNWKMAFTLGKWSKAQDTSHHFFKVYMPTWTVLIFFLLINGYFCSFRFPNLPYEIDKFLNVLYSAFWNDFKNKIDCMGIKFLKIELNLVVLAVLNSMPFWITRNAKLPKIHVFNSTALYCNAKTSERAWGEGGPRKILNFNGKLSHVFCSHIWLGTPESFWGSQDR